MSNVVHVRIACPTEATFEIQIELDREYSDSIVGIPVTSTNGGVSVIEFDSTDHAAIYFNPLLVNTPGVTITTNNTQAGPQ